LTAAPALHTLITQARRRALLNLVWEQTSVGAAAALAGALALLLFGTDLLAWYWPVVLFGVGTGIAAWRTMRTLPSPYSVAQTVDSRLRLSDTLSTAYHFLQPDASSRSSADFLEAQQSGAERLAAAVPVSQAMPLRVPRQLYPAAALLAAAGALFLIRHGVLGTLDLRAPIVEAVADFFQPTKEVAVRGKQPKRPGQDPLTIPLDQSGATKQPDLEKAGEEALSESETPDVNAGIDTKDMAQSKQSQIKSAGDQAGDDLEEAGEEGMEKSGESGKEGGPDGKGGMQDQGDKQSAQNAKQGGNDPNQSLMDKMRDAMANLMNKMKIPNQGQQQASNQKGSQQQKGPGEQSGSGQKGEKGQGQQQGKGTPSDDPDADANQGEQQAQAGQGKSNDKTADAGTPTDAKSGMGKQDGSKDLRDAEQLAAMGKLTEVFGKRAQNMAGDVMVEVTNNKQQNLRTSYTQRQAVHREAGSEIHRDEVPLEYQHYVQQYFDQVRKGEKPVGVTAPPK